MADHVTPNLPSRDFDVTEAFYAKLGFATSWKDRGWMILQRGGLQLRYRTLIDGRQVVEQRQAQQALALFGGVAIFPWNSPKCSPAGQPCSGM